MKKIIILSSIILIFLVLQPKTAQTKGIIIADDQKILNIFRDYDQSQIIELAHKIKKYDKVILHLGAKRVFSRGHPFFYKTSRKNLSIFAEQLHKQNQKFYLWFLDSFGNEMFLNIYENHQLIIDSNYKQLEKLNFEYDGIVIDLEWINLNLEDETLNDNKTRYLRVLKYLKDKFNDKELYSFISIVNDTEENLRRGYNEKEILEYLNNIIVMLYIKDAGFKLVNEELQPILKDNRIDNLRLYYNKSNYQTAVSLAGGVFLERDKNLYFLKTTNHFTYEEQSQLFYCKEKNIIKY